jgi:hypothetical protein
MSIVSSYNSRDEIGGSSVGSPRPSGGRGGGFVQIGGRLDFEPLTFVLSPSLRGEAGIGEQRIEIDWIFGTLARTWSSR